MGATLRVLSANLWNGAADAEAFARQVSDLAADVVAVQELSHEQAEALALVMPYGVMAPRDDYMGMGVLSRRPTRVEDIPLPYRSGQAMQLDPADWSGLLKPLEILNLHIAAPHVRPYGIGPFHRRRQWRSLASYLAGESRDARLCVGDFNSTPAWPIYRRMRSQFADAAEEAAARHGRRPLRTWGPTPGTRRLLRIDHGFVRGLRVADFRVVPVRGSDHSAICVDLELG